MKLKFCVWNADRARQFNRRPMTSNRAGRLADLLEQRTGEMHVVVFA